MESYGNYLYLLHESTCVLTFMEVTQFHRKRQLNYGLTISRSTLISKDVFCTVLIMQVNSKKMGQTKVA